MNCVFTALYIYNVCAVACKENKIMSPVYISARQTDAGDTQTVAHLGVQA